MSSSSVLIAHANLISFFFFSLLLVGGGSEGWLFLKRLVKALFCFMGSSYQLPEKPAKSVWKDTLTLKIWYHSRSREAWPWSSHTGMSLCLKAARSITPNSGNLLKTWRRQLWAFLCLPLMLFWVEWWASSPNITWQEDLMIPGSFLEMTINCWYTRTVYEFQSHSVSVSGNSNGNK